MTKTISQLWCGNLEPIVDSGVSNPKINYALNSLIRNQDEFKAELNEKQKKLFDNYDESNNEYLALTNEQAFCDGFCLGMKIASEALIGAEEII